MDLDSLLNAHLSLERRIATDQALRRYLATLWQQSEPTGARTAQATTPQANGKVRLTFDFPPEMCELLAVAARATGKSTAQILEESFADYFRDKIDKLIP